MKKYSKSFGLVCLFTFMLCLLIPKSTTAQSVEAAGRLNTDLLANYSKKIRPVVDQKDIVNVNITFNLVAIQEFDELLGKLSIVGFLQIIWMDHRLMWNPMSYEGMTSVIFDLEDMWKPPLALSNPFDKIKQLGKEMSNIRVIIL